MNRISHFSFSKLYIHHKDVFLMASFNIAKVKMNRGFNMLNKGPQCKNEENVRNWDEIYKKCN